MNIELVKVKVKFKCSMDIEEEKKLELTVHNELSKKHPDKPNMTRNQI